MSPDVRSHLDLAHRFLHEVEAIDPRLHPLMTMHAAYYAMLHLATAVLLDRGFPPSRRHSTVIANFARLTRDASEPLRRAAVHFREAHDARLRADYDPAAVALEPLAADMKRNLAAFAEATNTLLPDDPG